MFSKFGYENLVNRSMVVYELFEYKECFEDLSSLFGSN